MRPRAAGVSTSSSLASIWYLVRVDRGAVAAALPAGRPARRARHPLGKWANVRIAITGVTGFIGRRLATRALEAGHDVTAFSRRAWTGAPHVALVDRHFLELPERPAPSVLEGVDAVVHLAIAPQTADAAVVDAVNRLGSIRLFEDAMDSGVGRFVFVSSQSAHADATSAYGRTKYAVEQRLGDDPHAVIVRPGLVYGDSDDGLMGRAGRAAAKLRVFPVIGGERRGGPAHPRRRALRRAPRAGGDGRPAAARRARGSRGAPAR